MVKDLVANDARHLKALLACDGIDDHVAMDSDKVLRVKNAILILQRSYVSLCRKLPCASNRTCFRSATEHSPKLEWGVELFWKRG